MGGRGQGQDHRPPRQGARLRRALPGRAQRRPHGRRQRRDLRPPARPVRRVLRPRDASDRQWRGGRSEAPRRRDRPARGARHQLPPAVPVEPRPPDLPVAPGARRAVRGSPRRRQDRHDVEGHRAGVRRQGAQGRAAGRRPARSCRVPGAVGSDRQVRERHDRRPRRRAARRRGSDRPLCRRTGRAPGAARHRHGDAVARGGRPRPPPPAWRAPRRRSSTSTTAPIRS